jgi:hypothetical protein
MLSDAIRASTGQTGKQYTLTPEEAAVIDKMRVASAEALVYNQAIDQVMNILRNSGTSPDLWSRVHALRRTP